MQYVGETAQSLNKRINIHRTAKVGCEHTVNHYKNVCKVHPFYIQIIETFAGTGYKNNKLDPKDSETRLEREAYWVKQLRTLYPYGLNDRLKGVNSADTIGTLFPPVPRHGDRPVRSRRSRNNHLPNTNVENVFINLNTLFQNNLRNAFFQIRVTLNNIKKKILKLIANTVLIRSSNINFYPDKEQYYAYILDIIDTKIYRPKQDKSLKRNAPKNICIVQFINKGVEKIHLSSIFNIPEIVNLLPSPELRTRDNLPVVTYSLGNTIRNKVLNYKDTVNSIFIDDEVSFSTETDTCQCDISPFKDKDHGHILTGDLRIIENAKLRKLLSKGPNFREPRTINYKKCIKEITIALDACIDKLCDKNKLKTSEFKPWRDAVLNAVNTKADILAKKLSLR